MPRRRALIILAGILLLSLGLRIALSDFTRPFSGDEEDYHNLAVSIVATGAFADQNGTATAWRTPGFPVALAAVYSTFGTDTFTARLVFLFLSLASIILVFSVAQTLFSRYRVSLVAAALWALSLNGIVMGSSLVPEPFAALAVIGAIALCARKSDGQGVESLTIALAGVVLGIAVLTRGYLLPLLGLIPVYLLLDRRRISMIAIFLAFGAILPLAWSARNRVELGAFTLSTETWQVIWHGNNRWSRGTWNNEWLTAESEQRAHLRTRYPEFSGDLTELQRSEIFREDTYYEITGSPARVLKLVPRKILIYLSPISYMGTDWTYLLVSGLSLVGVFLLARVRRDYASLSILVLPVFAVALTCVITFGDPRFRYPVEFGLYILAALCLDAIIMKNHRRG